jgi:hypothetical protein
MKKQPPPPNKFELGQEVIFNGARWEVYGFVSGPLGLFYVLLNAEDGAVAAREDNVEPHLGR